MDAHTLEQMLDAVPRLGQCDSLAAVPVLASYDRQSYGWLSTVVFWLTTVALIAVFMIGVGFILFSLGISLVSVLTPQLENLVGATGGPLAQLLLFLAGAMLVVLIFNKLGPRRALVDATRRFQQRIRLRLLLLKAIGSQKQRNQTLVAGRWQTAVCRICLAHFKAYRVRFAYSRWLTFGRCRKCLDDRNGYTGVERIAGWLDHGMPVSHEQVRNAVRVNLRFRLPPHSELWPTDLDELVIANVDDEDVELLIFCYRSQQPQTELPKPKRLPCRVTGTSAISQISRRQLRRYFSLVT